MPAATITQQQTAARRDPAGTIFRSVGTGGTGATTIGGQVFGLRQTAAPSTAKARPGITLGGLPDQVKGQIQLGQNAAHTNTYSPTGSVVHTDLGNGRWATNYTLSPEQQRLLDQNEALAAGALSAAGTAYDNALTATKTPLNFAKYPAMPTSLNMAGAPAMPTSVNAAGMWNYGGGPQQHSLDFSGLGTLPQATDQGRMQVSDALYQQAASRLDPQWGQEEQSLRTRLANQGLEPGSAAWNREMDAFTRRRTDAYNQASWSAIGAGGQEQSRLFGLQLAGRQQGASERQQAAQFGLNADNQAFNQIQAQRSQIFGQGLSNAQLQQQAREQATKEAALNAGLQQQARQQQISEDLTRRGQAMNEAAWWRTQGQMQPPASGLFGLPGSNASPEGAFARSAAQDAANQQAKAQERGDWFNLAGTVLGNAGGIASGINALWSSRALKQTGPQADGAALLAAVEGLEIGRWRYRPGVVPGDTAEHVGPYAEDFRQATGLGDGRTIDPVDALGVLFAALKALARRVRSLEAAAGDGRDTEDGTAGGDIPGRDIPGEKIRGGQNDVGI